VAVAGQVVDDRPGMVETVLGIDHPLGSHQRVE
jgi:hypothetical protein